jgi:hypothetical protein
MERYNNFDSSVEHKSLKIHLHAQQETFSFGNLSKIPSKISFSKAMVVSKGLP